MFIASGGKTTVEINLARQCILFHGLVEEEIHRIVAMGQEQTHRKGDILTVQGSREGKVFVLLEGMVEVRIEAKKGPRPIVALGPGQLIGEITLVDGGPHSATVVVTHTPTRVLAFDREALLALCEAQPHIGYVLMRNIAADLGFKVRHHNLSLM